MGFLINRHCLFVSLWFEPFWTFLPFITLERRRKSLVGPNEMNWEPCKRQARRPGPFAVHVLCHQFLPWTGAGISEDEFAPWLHGWHGSFSTLDLHSTSPDVFGGLIVCLRGKDSRLTLQMDWIQTALHWTCNVQDSMLRCVKSHDLWPVLCKTVHRRGDDMPLGFCCGLPMALCFVPTSRQQNHEDIQSITK